MDFPNGLSQRRPRDQSQQRNTSGHPVAVHLIHRSARPLTAAPRVRTHRTGHIGIWVQSPLGHDPFVYV